MKTAPRVWRQLTLVAGATLGAVFFALPVHAQTVIATQPNKGAAVYNFSGWTQNIGTGLQGTDIHVTMNVQSNSGTQSVTIRIDCYNESTYSTQCAGTWPLNSDSAVSVSTTQADRTWDWATLQLDPTKYYMIRNDSAYNVKWYGMPLANLYYIVTAGQAIDWNALWIPVVYSTSAQAIATSSSLWGSLSLASSTQNCASDNFFTNAICSSFTYLFIPNQEIISAFVGLGNTVQLKFPVSWYVGIRDTIGGLTGSSTPNMASVNIDFSSVDPATSTIMGPILPNAVVLSSTTISTYLSPSLLSLLLTLEAAALYVIVGFSIYSRVRHKWLHE